MIPSAYFGGVSVPAVEAAFRVSHEDSKPVGLMFTENQCGIKGGYVFRYDALLSRIAGLTKRFPNHKVILARDHFRPNTLDRSAITQFELLCLCYLNDGFRSLHLDFDVPGSRHSERLRAANGLIKRLRAQYPSAIFELSLCKDDSISELEIVVAYREQIAAIEPNIVVIPTGSRIHGGAQVGSFHAERVSEISSYFEAQGIWTKEHNADFLSSSEITKRTGIINSMNVAPELGYQQSALTILLASAAGLEIDAFLDDAARDGNTARWFDSREISPLRIAKACGHYVFRHASYEALKASLERSTDFSTQVASVLDLVLRRYLS